MAKPTVRIPDWSSGGTNTDPGGSKETAGWLVDERPPAFWWNWILNALGQWTEHHSLLIPRAVGSVNVASGTPSILWEEGDLAIDNVATTSTYIAINYATGIVGTATDSHVSTSGTSGAGVVSVTDGYMFSATQARIYTDVTEDSQSVRIGFAIFGDKP